MAKVPQAPDSVCSLHDWMTLRTELLFIVDSPIPAGAGDRAGGREREFSAWLVCRGWARIESDGERAEARAGEWLVCSGRHITQTFSPNVHLLAMRVSQNWPDGSPLYTGGSVTVLKAAKYPALERTARRLQGLVEKLRWAGADDDPRAAFQWRSRMDYRTFMAYQKHLQAWLLALADGLEEAGRQVKVPDGGDPRLAKVCQLLDTLPEGAPYPGKQLAEAGGGVTAGRLNQLFYKAYGLTTRQYWERRRLERARLFLDNPMIPIKQVAFDLGFSRLSHFSRWFKQRGGLSPRHYRQAGASVLR